MGSPKAGGVVRVGTIAWKQTNNKTNAGQIEETSFHISTLVLVIYLLFLISSKFIAPSKRKYMDVCIYIRAVGRYIFLILINRIVS